MSDENIGWYWRVVGLVLMLSAVGLAAFKLIVSHSFVTSDVILIALLLFASLVVVRPEWMDRNFKTILDAIPFVKFTKKPPEEK